MRYIGTISNITESSREYAKDSFAATALTVRGTCSINGGDAEGYTLEVHRDVHVLTIYVTFEGGREIFSTHSTQDWPIIDRFIPRAEWPREIAVGRKGAGNDTPDTRLRDLLDGYMRAMLEDDRDGLLEEIADLDEDDAEAEEAREQLRQVEARLAELG